MKGKGYIALLLLAAYLLATGGPAVASLTCKCVAQKEVHAAVSCCVHCAHIPSEGGQPALSAPCCDDRHSTDIDLYTASSSDANERLTRCAVWILPPALAPDEPCVAASPDAACQRFRRRDIPLYKQSDLLCVGLRAPPVLA